MPQLTIVQANLADPRHRRHVLLLTQAYAEDPMGNGAALPAAVCDRLIDGLAAHPTTLIFLAYVDEDPVGIATCFVGFSTFAARPLINIHDLAVLPNHRGSGVGRALLQAVEDHARRLGCCKLTLEVLEHNRRARETYERCGFAQATYAQNAGGALFFTKAL
jgi:GNAT superfamily N-acetyltransferase